MRSLAIVCLAVSLAAADGKPVVKNAFAFDWLHPKSSKCAKVTGALDTKLGSKQFTCVAPDGSTGTASGKPLLATCTERGKKTEYLVFAKLDDCKAERDTQLANGE